MRRTITVNNKDLIVNTHSSNLKDTARVGDTTLEIYSIAKFSTNQILCIGEIGTETAELVYTHAATSPTGTTITLTAALTKDHPSDVKVYILPYDQIEFSWVESVDQSKYIISTEKVDVEKEFTQIYDDSHGNGYYFSRFYNSLTTLFAEYSDPIPFDGNESNTVGYIIDVAMRETRKEFSENLTYEDCLRSINACLRFARGKLKKWSHVETFGHELGLADRGVYSMDLPSTYYNKNNNRSMLQVRIGDSAPLRWVDKREFDGIMVGSAVSTATTATAVGSTTLTLASTNKFPDSGSVSVFVNNVLQTLTYTANDRTTGILSGIPASGDGSITTIIPANNNVWYNIAEGAPYCYTIYGGKIYWMNTHDGVGNKTIVLDFYHDIVEVDSDGDVIPDARFDMVKHWLKAFIRSMTERDGRIDLQDTDYILFLTILDDAKHRETTSQKYRMIPLRHGMKVRAHATSGDTFLTE